MLDSIFWPILIVQWVATLAMLIVVVVRGRSISLDRSPLRWAVTAVSISVGAIWLILAHALPPERERRPEFLAPAIGATAGLLALVVLSLVVSRGTRRGEVLLVRRTLWDHVGPLAVTSGVGVVLSIGLFILTGLVSSPDDIGDYRVWFIDHGHGFITAAGDFPGWYFVVPALVLVAATTVLAVLVLVAWRNRPTPPDKTAQQSAVDRALVVRTSVSLVSVATFGLLGNALYMIGEGLTSTGAGVYTKDAGFVGVDGAGPVFGWVVLIIGAFTTAFAVAALINVPVVAFVRGHRRAS